MEWLGTYGVDCCLTFLEICIRLLKLLQCFYAFLQILSLLKIDKNMKKILLITFLFAFIWNASAQRRRNINYSTKVSHPNKEGGKL